jgi:NADPH-dependent F420 reductase
VSEGRRAIPGSSPPAPPAGCEDRGMTQQRRSTAELPDVSGLSIGILGGTGDQGKGLARRFALAGHEVIIGSRRAERAAQAAAELHELASGGRDGGESAGGGKAGGRVRGAENAAAAGAADVVIIAVPWEGHRATLESLRAELAGKIVIDCVNPMGFDKQGAFPLPVEEGSAAQQAAAVLDGSRVVGAFHHVSAVLLLDPEVGEMELDVLVLGDDREATDVVRALAYRIPGMRGVYAGRLRNAAQIEALTANLISINRRYKAHAGFRVTDV